MKNVCFTGHRSLKGVDYHNLKVLLDDTICALVKKGATDFYCGGALGWDTLCANMVLYLKKRKAQDIKLHLVLPCSNEAQTMKWSQTDKDMFYSILSQADSVEYTSHAYTKECMRIRNARLVELGDCCVAFYNAADTRSGTGQTVRMAEDKGIEVINIYEMAD